MNFPTQQTSTESQSLDALLNAQPPEQKKGFVYLVLAGIAATSDAIETIVSIRGILFVLTITCLLTQNTRHLDVLIGTLGGSLMPQIEKRDNKKLP